MRTLVILMEILLGGALGWVSGTLITNSQHCTITQPVYAGSTRISTWSVTLHPGQSVTLPDSDTAACTWHGLRVS